MPVDRGLRSFLSSNRGPLTSNRGHNCRSACLGAHFGLWKMLLWERDKRPGQGSEALNQFNRIWAPIGLPRWLKWWSICLQCRRPGFDPWVGKIPWRRKWQPTPVVLPRKLHGRRSLVDYSPWGCKESDTTERLHFSLRLQSVIPQGKT